MPSSQISFIKKSQNLIKFDITNINDYFHNEVSNFFLSKIIELH